MYLDGIIQYKLVLEDAKGVMVWTADNVVSADFYANLLLPKAVDAAVAAVQPYVILAQQAQAGAELARDAAVANANLFPDEASGRAATADGKTFLVQGSGDIAAYVYRRINASTSTLITTYSAGEVVQELHELLSSREWTEDISVSVGFSDGSRTWMEAKKNGLPTDHAAQSIRDVVGVDPVADDVGLSAAMLTAAGRMLAAWRYSGVPVFSGPVPYVASSFTAFGDSTTFGDGLTSTYAERWTTLLSARIGAHIENRGVNGAMSGDIAARYGAITAAMTVSGGVVPASGSVVLNALDLNPTRGAPAFPVEILCEGGERISGTLLPASFGTATFARYTAGTAVNSTRVLAMSRMSEQSKRRVLFVGMGINDEPGVVGGTTKISTIKSYYRAISVSQAAAKPVLVVWGMLDRGLAEAPGTPIGNFIAEIEQFLLEEFGSSFAPVRQFLASSYALTVAALLQPGFSPTTADNDAIAAGVTPPSYRVGGTSVHLNPLGHQLQAWFFHQHLITRGLA